MAKQYVFSQAGVKRLIDAAKVVERIAKNNLSPGNRAFIDFGQHIDGVLTTSLSRGTLAAPDTATMAIYVYDAASGWVDTGQTLTIQDHGKLPEDVTLDAGVQVGAKYAGGAWVLADYDCALEVIE